jgi:hypothetical protein
MHVVRDQTPDHPHTTSVSDEGWLTGRVEVREVAKWVAQSKVAKMPGLWLRGHWFRVHTQLVTILHMFHGFFKSASETLKQFELQRRQTNCDILFSTHSLFWLNNSFSFVTRPGLVPFLNPLAARVFGLWRNFEHEQRSGRWQLEMITLPKEMTKNTQAYALLIDRPGLTYYKYKNVNVIGKANRSKSQLRCLMKLS